jgi:hypothetical protein
MDAFWILNDMKVLKLWARSHLFIIKIERDSHYSVHMVVTEQEVQACITADILDYDAQGLEDLLSNISSSVGRLKQYPAPYSLKSKNISCYLLESISRPQDHSHLCR